jgi:glyoxylase-like metal-dependent hydrolase (beta-lactamase superfamily II)
MTTDTYEIVAIKYAERTDRKRYETFLMSDDHDAPCPIDFFLWVIRNEDRIIVVDTGFDEAENQRREGRRRMLRTPGEALSMVGVAADTVETVVITHLHFDHAGSLDAFGKARFHLQAAEMTYATGPCMCHANLQEPFTAEHVCGMVRRVYSGRVVFHDGDAAIAPGVTVHKLGGHSRGLQCLRVMTGTGPVVLASDGTHFYENFELSKVFPVVVDVEDVLSGYARMEQLAASRRHIVPGHDPLVLRRYPALDGRMEGIAHRVDVARLDE